MKISIITYHDEDNYGATLQAYATYKAIQELGFIPEIVNLHMSHKKNIFIRLLYCQKRRLFNNFRNKYMPNKTICYYSLEELRKNPPLSDVYLVGSDQTWNPSISKEYALAYFLDFGAENHKRISYASSFGKTHWEDSDYIKKDKAKRLLSRFASRLVREDKGVKLLNDEFGLSSYQVVDPVLLFPSYQELTGEIRDSNDLVVYKIINDVDFYKRAVTISKDLECGIRSVGSMRRLRGIKSPYPESIEDWISIIAGAKYVFTDSFHGTVISLLYHRQFVVYVGNPKLISRITSLLSMVGLADRICTNTSSLDEIKNLLNQSIDYDKVDNILKKQRSLSLSRLKSAILTDN